MNDRILLFCVVAIFWLTDMTLCRGAAPENRALEKDGWQVRVFRLPTGHEWNESVPLTVPSPERVALALPAAGASAALWEKCLRSSSKVIGGWCHERQLEPPSGTLFLHDVVSGTLAVRSTQRWLNEFEYFTELSVWDVPMTVVCEVEILQSDATTIRELLKATAGTHDHAEALQKLKAMAQEGRARAVQQLRVETKSGQQVTTKAGADVPYTRSVTIDEAGRAESARGARLVGTTFEVDPVVGPDHRHIAVNLALEHHFAPPAQRAVFIGQIGKRGVIAPPVTDYRMVKLMSALSLVSGATRVLGVWTPEGTPEFSKGDMMQAAFLRVNTVRALPPKNEALAQKLKDHGPRVTPGMPPAEPQIPAGMERRWFKVPWDYLPVMGSGSAAPADPFGPVNVPRSPPRVISTMAILKAQGIDFPEGASARFISEPSLLTVINTPKNLEVVEALIDEIGYCGWPYVIAHSLQIIEGESEVLRQLAQRAQTEADQGAIWKQVEAWAAQDRVKLLRTARLETRSGQRVSFESGIYRANMADIRFQDRKGLPMAGAGHADRRLMRADFESSISGTRLEIDPVVGPDGWTVDLDFAFGYAYAPPTAIIPDASSDGQTTRIGFPATHSPESQIRASITLTWGMTKLLGLWKPEGTPEFDGKDVMQAAFLRVDRAPVEAEVPVKYGRLARPEGGLSE